MTYISITVNDQCQHSITDTAEAEPEQGTSNTGIYPMHSLSVVLVSSIQTVETDSTKPVTKP